MPLLSLLSNEESDLAINTGVAETALTDKLNSLSVVTAYSHAMLNTVINPVTKPAESWYTTLKGHLDTAKEHALFWTTDVAPQIGSIVPQSIIDFNNEFSVNAAAIMAILQPATDTRRSLTQDELKRVIGLIESTLASVEEQKSSIKVVGDNVKKVAGDFVKDHENLVEGQNGAAAAVKLAKQEQLAIGNKIQELQTRLDAARAKATASGIGLGVSIFIAAACFALAFATGGATLAVIGAIGLVGVGVSATFTGIFTAEISSLIEEISEKQTMLADKQKQVSALSGLTDTVNKLIGHNEEAKTAMTNVQTMWSTLYVKMDAVVKNLKAGKDVAETLKLSKIGAAQRSWNDAAAFAQKIQDTASGTQVLPNVQHRTLRLA